MSAASGSNTLVQVDSNGNTGGNVWVTLATLTTALLAEGNTGNFVL